MNRLYPVIAVLLLTLSPHSSALQTMHQENVTGAYSWSTRANGVFFSLTQILPDQANAFYVNRGFTLDQIKDYATSCVYMTVIRNEQAPGTIHFISNQWTIINDGIPHPLVSVDKWLNRFKSQGINNPALVAFRWAQFPPEQEYEPGGDWNQGMLSIGLPPGSEFDVIAHWDIHGKPYQAKLTGVKCAE